jgi:hypothetical protein
MVLLRQDRDSQGQHLTPPGREFYPSRESFRVKIIDVPATAARFGSSWRMNALANFSAADDGELRLAALDQ